MKHEVNDRLLRFGETMNPATSKSSNFENVSSQNETPRHRLLYLILLFLFVVTNKSLFSQNREIEIVVTYDQYFLSFCNANNLNPVDEIATSFAKINEIYENQFNIFIDPVKIFQINIKAPTSNFDLRNQISSLFDNVCVDIDMIHHFTSYSTVGIGTSSGGNLCDVGNGKSNNASFSNYEVPSRDWINAAHEIGHNLGLSHVEPCDGNYLMCLTGPPLLGDPILFTPAQQNILTNLNSPCLFSNTNLDCFFCNFTSSQYMDNRPFNTECGDNIRLLGADFKNSCGQNRNAVITFKYFENEVIILEKDPLFVGSDVVQTEDFINGRKRITLTKNQLFISNTDYSFDFKIQILKGYFQSNTSDYSTELNLVLDFDQNLPSNVDYAYSYEFKGKYICDIPSTTPTNEYNAYNHCGSYYFPLPIGVSMCVNGIPMKWKLDNKLEIIDKLYMCKNSEIENTNQNLSEIVVKSGSTLYIDGGKLFTCGDNLWKGITVESGGTLILDNAIISDALYGITVKSGGNVKIKNSFFYDCYVGIKLEDGANLIAFESNTIQTLNGVKPTTLNALNWSPKTYAGIIAGNNSKAIIGSFHPAIGPNIFFDMAYGIVTNASDFIITRNRFEKIDIAIKSENCVNLSCLDNTFKENEVSSLYAYESGLEFKNNIIENSRRFGGQVHKNSGKRVLIKDNTIDAGYVGVEVLFSGKVTIEHNEITTNNSDYTFKNPIALRSSRLIGVVNNQISFSDDKSSHTAILNSSCSNNTIKDNFVLDEKNATTKRAIALLGGNSNTTQCNFINEFIDGTYINNSSGNTLECNDFWDQTNSDINVNTNSIFQLMKGNFFSDASTQLILKSVIGKQYDEISPGVFKHHGNIWPSQMNEGANASILSQLEVLESQFKVDFNKSNAQNKNWYPRKPNGDVNSNPMDLFADQESNNIYECQGCTFGLGGFLNWFNGSPSPESICNWLKAINNRLKPRQIAWWKNYIYRLIKKSGRPYEALSPCLQTIVNEINVTKQKNIENVKEKIDNILAVNSSVSIQNQYNTLSSITDAAANGNFNEANYQSAITALKIEIGSNNIAVLTDLQAANFELSQLANDPNYSDESIIYTNILSYLQNAALPNDPMLRSISEQCSDIGGENIFLAKDLLALIGEVNPYESECLEERGQKEIPKVFDNDFSSVSPSISSGLYNIIVNDGQEYALKITNAQGKEVLSIFKFYSKTQADISTAAAGLYFISIEDISNKSRSVTHKVVKH